MPASKMRRPEMPSAPLSSFISLLGSTTDDALPDKILNQFVKLIPAERSAVLMGSDPENLDVLTMRPTPFAVSRTVIG